MTVAVGKEPQVFRVVLSDFTHEFTAGIFPTYQSAHNFALIHDYIRTTIYHYFNGSEVIYPPIRGVQCKIVFPEFEDE